MKHETEHPETSKHQKYCSLMSILLAKNQYCSLKTTKNHLIFEFRPYVRKSRLYILRTTFLQQKNLKGRGTFSGSISEKIFFRENVSPGGFLRRRTRIRRYFKFLSAKKLSNPLKIVFFTGFTWILSPNSFYIQRKEFGLKIHVKPVKKHDL